jgi:hypothetical protein
MIQPGVCSEKTTGTTHLNACTVQSVLEVCGNADNQVRGECSRSTGYCLQYRIPGCCSGRVPYAGETLVRLVDVKGSV